jgi:ABC-2 type transport system permease protein
MKGINLNAVYILWLREMKTFYRAKSRIVGTVVTPLFLLAFLGFGFAGAILPGVPSGVNYLEYLTPGIIGMTMIFTSMFTGLSVLWDRRYGFLKEIMVTPVSRLTIVLGRIAGGLTTSMIEGLSILAISLFLGFRISGIIDLILTLAFMLLVSVSFIGLGLAIASILKDEQGFGLIMNFIISPLLFLSGIFYPVENLPLVLRVVSYLNPLTYGVDGLRGALIGVSFLPWILNLAILTGFCVGIVLLGTLLFEKNEAV